MSILVNKDTRLLVQGFTGSQATLHSEQSIEYGTNMLVALHLARVGKRT